MSVIVYQTTNLVNGKIYIGVRNLDIKRNLLYLGSGIALKSAIEKYGRENFERKTLFEFDTQEEAFAREAEIVNEEFIKRKDTYNMATGGRGGNTSSGRTLTEEHKNKLSRALKGRKLDEATKSKISAALKRRTDLNRATFTGKTHSRLTKEKMSKSAKNREKLTCPYCSKRISKNVAYRWHFSNCKLFS